MTDMSYGTGWTVLSSALEAGCPNLVLVYEDRPPDNWDKHARLKTHPQAQIYCCKQEHLCTCSLARKAGVELVQENGEMTEADLKEARDEIRADLKRRVTRTNAMIAEATDRLQAALEAHEFLTIRKLLSILDWGRNYAEAETEADLWASLAARMIDKDIYANKNEDAEWEKKLNKILEACGLEPVSGFEENAVSTETEEVTA